MAAPVRRSRGRLTYTGRLPRAAFAAWLDTPEGRRVVSRAASRISFTLLGKARAARRRLWRDVRAAATTRTVAGRVQAELDSYLAHLERIVYARELPRTGVELRRLVVVPRRLLSGDLYRRLEHAVGRHPTFAATEEGVALRHWFVLAVVDGADAVVARARPTPWRPLPAGADWMAVGLNLQFEWYAPPDGPTWPGHYHVLEQRRDRVTRAVRRATRDAIADMERSLGSLPRARRYAILDNAAGVLDQQVGA